MPNIITHTLFAHDLMAKMNGLPLLQNNKQLVEIGSNGPDILFFHGLSPKRRFQSSELSKMGSVLHDRHINDFYLSALKSIRNENDPAIKEQMIAYTCGHLCHWALDSTTHPYIFYRTGTCKGDSAKVHHRFESLLDAIVLKVKTGHTVSEMDISQICKPSTEQARAIVRVYIPALNSIFDKDVAPHKIVETLEDWQFMQKVFHDPSGKKIKNLHRLEKLFGLQNLFSGYLVPNEPVDNYDLMNLLHKTWRNPATGQESDQSFFELYDEALAKAATAIDLFVQAIDDPQKEEAFLAFVDNANYNLGINTPMEMKYFEIVDLNF
jgi:hypothetical protein